MAALIAKADQGDAAACFAVYEAYYDGKGVKADEAKAQPYLERAAKAGLAEAQAQLAEDLWRRDPPTALDWAVKAADQGSVEGHFMAARLLQDGRGIAADAERAEKHLRAAAAAGHERAIDMVKSIDRRREAAVKGPEVTMRNLVVAHELTEHIEAILGLRQPSIRAAATPIGGGRSRLGGRPELPAGTEWPTLQGRPLCFVALIALEEVAPFDSRGMLPREGTLSFFFDFEGMYDGKEHDPGKVKVIYSPAGTSLQPLTPSTKLEEYQACRLTFFGEDTLPFVRTSPARSLQLDDDGNRCYRDMLVEWYEVRHEPTEDGKVHRLLGHPDAIQGDMTRRLVYGLKDRDLDEPLPELEEEAKHWRLLLQIDSDEAANMMWADLGRLFFWIRDDDLSAARFDRVYAQVQSG